VRVARYSPRCNLRDQYSDEESRAIIALEGRIQANSASERSAAQPK